METSARYAIVGFFTVVSLLAGFLFVYWLHESGGAGQTLYQIRFDQPVIGVRPGVSVLFNGLRVGEVREVKLSAADPKEVMALVAVTPSTPVRADTMVTIDSQGLMGSAVVSMVGGSPGAEIRREPDSGPPTLIASAQAGQTVSQAAKETLQKIDGVIGDNSEALKSAIANINTFSGALARNSDKVDSILAGLAKLAGASGEKKSQGAFELAAPAIAPGKSNKAQLSIPDLTGLIDFDTARILISRKPGERSQIEGGQWNDTLQKLVQEKMLETLEAAGFENVAKGMDGFDAQYQLILDIRAFELHLEPQLAAKVEINAKILGKGGHILGSRSFTGDAPAKSAQPADAAAALNAAFAKVATDLADWVRQKV
jgi:phospholipid/cholesterol/gamma-HCH transport system substrate-binding protein